MSLFSILMATIGVVINVFTLRFLLVYVFNRERFAPMVAEHFFSGKQMLTTQEKMGMFSTSKKNKKHEYLVGSAYAFYAIALSASFEMEGSLLWISCIIIFVLYFFNMVQWYLVAKS